MALVTADFLAGALTNYRAIFQKALSEGFLNSNDYLKIATVFNSTSDREAFNWLGESPSLSEWKDQRQLHGLRAESYTLVNKHYEATIEVDRDTYEDDKLGMIRPRIQGLATAALRYYNERVFSQLDDGESLYGYDTSYYFFADTRVIGNSANIDNLIEMACSGSADEIRAAIAAAQEKMRLFQDDWGKPMNLTPDTIVCAPEMEIAIKSALLAGVAGTVRPEVAFVKDIIVSPWIDLDATDWYMLCTTGSVKPLIFVLRKAPEFVALDNPKGDHVFKNKTFLYGVDTRFQVGFGDPRTAVKLKDV